MDLDRLEMTLRASRTEHFAPGFAGRVLRRADAIRRQSVSTVMLRYFAWMVPAAVTAIALLAIHNARVAGHVSALDAVLGLPSVTVSSAYTLDASDSAR